MAVKEPVFPLRPVSAGVDPLLHFQVPGAVATTRTRNVWPPSQKPYTRLLKFGPASSTHTTTSVYGLAYVRAAVNVSSCFSQT